MKKTNMTLNKLRIYLSNRKVNLTETDDSRIFSHSFDLKDYLSKYSSENTFKQNMSMQMYE